MSWRSPRLLWTVCMLLCCAKSAWPAPAPAPAAPTVESIVAKMPASSPQEGQALAAQLLKLGSPALRGLCAKLTPADKGGDAKPRYALHGLALYAARPGAEAERRIVAAGLVEALQASGHPEVQAFLIRCLQLVGKDEAVPALAKRLGHEELGRPAAQALSRIGTPQATEALLRGLSSAKGSNRVAIVQALGRLRSASAAKALLPLASSDDPLVRRAAQSALANIAAAEVGPILEQACKAESPYERSLAQRNYIIFLRRIAERGDKSGAVERARKIIQTHHDPRDSHVVCAALRTLALLLVDKAMPDLLAAARSRDDKVRGAALHLGRDIPGPDATRQWVQALARERTQVRVEIIAMLAQRGDKAALPALLAAIKDSDKAVRIAAAPAAVRLAGDAALDALLAAMRTGQDDEIKAVQQALMQVPGPRTMPAVARALPGMTPQTQRALLEVLAKRRARGQIEAVFAAASHQDSAVRVAALKALAALAQPEQLPRLVALLVNAQTSRELAAAQTTIVLVSEQIADPDRRSEPVLAAMAKATVPQRALLLHCLARIGGRPALDAVLADGKSPDAKLRDAAMRALCEWKDEAALPHVEAVAQTAKDLVTRVLALRGYARLVGLAQSLSPEEKLAKYRTAMEWATRASEKKLVLAGLSNVRTLEALSFVAAYLGDPALGQEAAAAAPRIAMPAKGEPLGLYGSDVREALKKAMAVSKSTRIRKQIQNYLDAMPKPDELNLAQGKRVSTNVPHERDRVPQRAVDGNTVDRSRGAWYAAKWPCWLKVDLEQPALVDAAQFLFYWDGKRYYQYTLEVSLDGESWSQVVDGSKNTKPGTAEGVMHYFKPIQARHVRLNILKNSANRAAHLVELKVYAAGKAPKPEPKPKPRPKPKPDAEGFVPLFNGKDLAGWMGSTKGYVAEDGNLVCLKKGGGNLYTEDEYSDFIFRFEFKLEPGSNNGVGLRVPRGAGAAYGGMEIQVLDNTAPKYAKLKPYQYHGSIYGVVPAKRGHLNPVGEWNVEEILADGRHIKVTLNGVAIVDADLDTASTPETMDGKTHPGLKRDRGHICFCGHGARVLFRRIRIKEIKPPVKP